MNRKLYFATKLNDTDTIDREGLGSEREEFDPILGLRKFVWVRNVSGGALTQGQWVAWEKQMTGSPFTVTATVGSNQANSTQFMNFAAATFTARAIAGMWARIHDDAGGAGAAPEGEVHRIKSNTDSLITLADDDLLSTAIGVGDTVAVFRPWHVTTTQDT